MHSYTIYNALWKQNFGKISMCVVWICISLQISLTDSRMSIYKVAQLLVAADDVTATTSGIAQIRRKSPHPGKAIRVRVYHGKGTTRVSKRQCNHSSNIRIWSCIYSSVNWCRKWHGLSIAMPLSVLLSFLTVGLNSLRPSAAYVRRKTYHHRFR